MLHDFETVETCARPALLPIFEPPATRNREERERWRCETRINQRNQVHQGLRVEDMDRVYEQDCKLSRHRPKERKQGEAKDEASQGS